MKIFQSSPLPKKPNMQEIADKFGIPVENVARQFLKNAATLRAMAEKAGNGKFRGLTAKELTDAADLYDDEVRHRRDDGLAVVIMGASIPFNTANEASEIVNRIRERSGLGARELGSQFPILDHKNQEVGYVSYNGIVWQGTRKHWKDAVQIFP